jgi:hypothetical protein
MVFLPGIDFLEQANCSDYSSHLAKASGFPALRFLHRSDGSREHIF